MHSPGAFQENFLALGNIWVGNAAVYRAHGRALFLVEEADTFGALLRSYIIDVFLDRGIGRPVEFPRRASFVNGGVWTLGFAGAAIDALFSNQRRHIATVLRTSGGLPARPARVGILPRFEREEYRRTPNRASICPRLRRHGSDDAFGEFLKGDAGGVRGVFDDEWHTFIARPPQFGLNRYACEQI